MYLEHFGLKDHPFRITPDTGFFFEGAQRGPILDALLYAVLHEEGITQVTGEVGSGKTMLSRVLIERLPPNAVPVYLANPSLARDEILRAIAHDLGLNLPADSSTVLLRALQEHLIGLFEQGKRVIVMIDEAHAMPIESLEEIRLLSNLETSRHKLLQIVLFGQQELIDVLAMPQLRPLRERVVHRIHLEPLMRADVEDYVQFRLRHAGLNGSSPFAPGTVKLIAEAAQGLSRRVNILADKALLAAFAQGSARVTKEHVKRAAAEMDLRRNTALPRWGWALAAAVPAVVLVAGIAVWWGQQRATLNTAPAFTLAAEDGAEQADALLEREAPAAGSPTLTSAAEARGMRWLRTVPGERATVQVLVQAPTERQVEEFLAVKDSDASLPQEGFMVLRYPAGQGFSVLFGDYPTLAEARAANTALPAWAKKFSPRARTASGLAKEWSANAPAS